MNETDKLIITVAPCGSFMGKDHNPNMPIQPKEIAEEVYRAWNEGASIAHIHARDKEGKGTTDPEVFREIDQRIRDKGCDIIIQHSTSPGREPGANVNDGLRALEPQPEMISIDIGISVMMRGGEEHIMFWTRSFVEKLAKAALEKGIKAEIELFTNGGMVEVESLLEKNLLTKPYWFSFVTDMHRTVQNVARFSPKNLMYMVELLPPGSMFTAMGIAAAETKAITTSILLGGHARVGFEDNLFYNRGVLAKSNAELVARAARIGTDLGRTIATPVEAREILGIPSLKTKPN